MRLAIHAVGRMKPGPASELFDHYLERARATGRQTGLRALDLREYPESRAGTPTQRRRQESERVIDAASGDRLIVLDETGRDMTSIEFAAILQEARDTGDASIALAIGGPDGHDPALLAAAAVTIRFGRMTWPHQLVRIMLAEQLYRAFTMLSGHPYHRG